MLEVVAPGLLTTVQDSGRPGAVDLGVPIGGACDPLSLAMANALVGNSAGEAALEMSVVGASFRVIADCVVAVAGADMGGLARGESRLLRSGETIEFGAAVDGSGVRTYLALAGGIDVPEVLGSRSTCLVGRFGGFDGRPLRAGDLVRSRGRWLLTTRRWPAAPTLPSEQRLVRVVRGPDAAVLGDAFDRLVGTAWTVGGRGDRQGIRLDGPALVLSTGATMLSRGVTWGSVQLPPDGQPIVLLADHQTVGGYPDIGVAISADRPTLGQLGPGNKVGFAEVSIIEAQHLLREQGADLERTVATLP